MSSPAPQPSPAHLAEVLKSRSAPVASPLPDERPSAALEFALAAASSAARIARATAALGHAAGDDDALAQTILAETERQIARIRQLYRLPSPPPAVIPVPHPPK